VVVCLRCEVVMRFGQEPASHGLCSRCFDALEEAARSALALVGVVVLYFVVPLFAA
jgi:hypothetical protein